MLVSQSKLPVQDQRVLVEMEAPSAEKRVKIRIENHDENLGWYCSGSLSLPLHQLPLLEQAVEEMRAFEASEEAGKIIPFPQVD